jgi:hypothetical protein
MNAWVGAILRLRSALIIEYVVELVAIGACNQNNTVALVETVSVNVLENSCVSELLNECAIFP